LELFVKAVGQSPNLALNVVYTTLNFSLIPNGVTYYGSGRSSTKKIPPQKFMQDLSQYYPYIVAWKVSKNAGLHGATLHIDDLPSGEVTDAWRELASLHLIKVYPNGDLCIPAISAADLCVRYLDQKLWKLRVRVEDTTISRVLDSLGIQNAHVHYAGHPDLKYLVPLEPRPLPLDMVYARPMIFVLKEGIIEKEAEYIRRRPEVRAALELLAYKRSTGFKLIDYSRDYRFLRDGDIVVYLGRRGQEQAEYLQTLGWKVETYSLKDLMETVHKS
jgi:hypothetical protein